jgi:hypothetical protein
MRNCTRDPVIYKKRFHFIYEAMLECVKGIVDLHIFVLDGVAPDSFKGTVSRAVLDF